MEGKHHYKTISKKEKGSMEEIHSYETFEDFLAALAKRNDYYEIKFIDTFEDGYKFTQHFIKGELQRPEQKRKGPVPQIPIIDIFDIFKEFANAAPSRGNNPVELLYDSIAGEDLSKPKVKVLKGGKE